MRRRLDRRAFLQAEARREMETAASAHLALDPDDTSHHFDELRGDGQSEACAPIGSSGRIVCLSERFKNQPLLLSGNSHAGVNNSAVQTN